MVDLINNKKYIENIKEYASYDLDYQRLHGKVVMLSGATGLIGRYFIDLLMYKNMHDDLNCKIIGLVRNIDKAKEMFKAYSSNDKLELIQCDVKNEIVYDGRVDYIIHAASNTYPIQYATDPVGTITTNVFGTYNLLDLAVNKKVKKFIFISSFEVYGDVKDIDRIGEKDFGRVDPTIVRSCYPESKRASESLCIAFSEQLNIDTSIVRLSRVFGPTMNYESSLATAQFIKKGLMNEDIVLKSDGMQLYSYNYVGDAVSAIIKVMLNGLNKEAYNVSDSKFDIRLKEFATIVADYANKEVVFDLPDEVEAKGFSNTVMTVLNNDKIKDLNWDCKKDIKSRIEETLDILK